MYQEWATTTHGNIKRPYIQILPALLSMLIAMVATSSFASEDTYLHGYHAVVVDSAGGRVVAVQEETNILGIFDFTSRVLVASISLPARAKGLELNEADGLALVANADDDTVSLVDLITATVGRPW